MLTDAAREGLAGALALRVGRCALAGADHAPLAEARGSAWHAALDNALALQALSHPAWGGRHDALCAAIAEFLQALECHGAIRRRAGSARLRILSDEPRRFHVETPSHRFTGDLWRGVVRQALRDRPGAPEATHSGNLILFRHRGRDHRIDAEDTIARCAVERRPGAVVLVHESRIDGRGRLDPRRRALGRLLYEYEIRGDTPVVALTVSFLAEPGVALEALRVTTALDALSPDVTQGYDAVTLRQGDASSRHAGFAASSTVLHRGPAESIGLRQRGAANDALALHLRPRARGQLHAVSVTGTAGGVAHWLLLQHEAPLPAPGGAVSIAEDRLLLSGDPRPDLDALFARTDPERGRDVALCPLPGVAAEALAAWALRAGSAVPGPLAATLGRMRAALGAAHAGEAQPDLADLAFAMLAEDAVLRAGDGAARANHAALLDRLLGVLDNGLVGGLGARAAALLALARAAALRPGDARIVSAIARGVAAIARDDADSPWGEGADTVECALLLRALRAEQAARACGVLALDAETGLRSGRLLRGGEAWLREQARDFGQPTGALAALLLADQPPDPMLIRRTPSALLAEAG